MTISQPPKHFLLCIKHKILKLQNNYLYLKTVKIFIIMIKKGPGKLIDDYFIKETDFKSEAEHFRAWSLVNFLILGILLLGLFMIKTYAAGTYSSLYVQFTFLVVFIGCLVLVRNGMHKIVADFLSAFLILFEISSIFFNYSGDIPMNFMYDEFYLLLVFLIFTPLFSSRWIIVVNTILVMAASISAFILKKDSFPQEITESAAVGLGVFILSVIVVFIFSYVYTDFIQRAIAELHRKIVSEEQKNKELSERAQIIRLQNEQIKLSKEKAEESNRLKSAFLSNMSHEIRTPMNAVLGFTEILKTTELSNKQKEYIQIIENSGKHLLNLINDIIDISKLESNQIKCEESKCNLNYLLNELKDFFTLNLIKENKENIKIILTKGFNDGQDIILTDAMRLRQILINLIGNAVKFTDKGRIEISYVLNKDSMLEFSVKDSGIGIPKSQLNNIFERFIQANESTEKKYGGTGLGLAIAKACTNLLNGDIRVKSEVGKGAEFIFTIPYKPAI